MSFAIFLMCMPHEVLVDIKGNGRVSTTRACTLSL